MIETSPAVERLPQVPDQIEAIEKNIGYLKECLAKLCDRLTPVLRTGVIAQPIRQEERELCLVARSLADINQEVSLLAGQINELIGRLEV